MRQLANFNAWLKPHMLHVGYMISLHVQVARGRAMYLMHCGRCRWLGKRFLNLPEDRQRQLKTVTITCVMVNKQTPRDEIYMIYQV